MKGKHDASENQSNDTLDTIESLAKGTKDGLSAAKTTAKIVGSKTPGVVGVVAKVSGAIAGAIGEKGGTWVEKATCGTAGVLAESYAAGPFMTAAMAGAASKAPNHPYAKAGFALGGALLAGPTIRELTAPIGEAAREVCHQAFDLARKANETQKTEAAPSPAKINQAATAEKKLTESNSLNQALNGNERRLPTVQAIPKAAEHSVHTVYKPHYYQDWNQPRPFHVPYNPIHNYYQAKIELLRYNLSPSQQLAAEFALERGFSYMNSLSSFQSTLSATNLIGTYNMYHPYLLVRDALLSCGQIGGVATQVSLIQNMLDSEAHAKAREYFICLPERGFPFPLNLVRILEQEIARGFKEFKTLPFFSLHFNNDGLLYPVLHPFYQNTLVGLIIALLDYWMKGYLNGGYFDENFLKQWSTLQNVDEAYLRANLQDLKKYCKGLEKDGIKINYESLREKESQAGALKAEQRGPEMKGMQTSFRIIAKQGPGLSLSGNVILADPEFEVKYTIELTPEAEAYLEEYHKEHGAYPEAYQKTKEGYIRFAEEIKEKMPKLPFFRDFLQLLGFTNILCYAHTNFEEMGLKPVVSEHIQTGNYQVPKSFPPLPIRYFQTYDLELSLLSFLKSLTPDELNTFNSDFFQGFCTEDIAMLSQADQKIDDLLKKKIHELIKTTISPKLQAGEVFECNEDELEKIVGKIKLSISATQNYLKTTYTEHLLQLLQPLGQAGSVKALNLPDKIAHTQKHLEAYFPKLKEDWEKAADLTPGNIVKGFGKHWHPTVMKTLQDVEEQLQTSKETAILLCKDVFGMSNPQEKSSLGKIMATPDYSCGLTLISMIKPGDAHEKGKLYLQVVPEGLKYQIMQKGVLKTNTLAWNELPVDFPKKDELLDDLKKESYLVLCKAIEKKGDLLSVQQHQREGFQKALTGLESATDVNFSKSYTLSPEKAGINPQKGCLYLEVLPAGLSYELFNFDGDHYKETIPWAALPPTFPRDVQQIAKLALYGETGEPDPHYLALFEWTQEKNHAAITLFQNLQAEQTLFLRLKLLIGNNVNLVKAKIAELSNLPAGHALSPAGVAALADMRAKLPQMEASLKSLNEQLTECQTKIANLPQEKVKALSDRKKKVCESILKNIEEDSPNKVKEIRKKKALELLEITHRVNLEQLKEHAQDIKVFSEYVFARPKGSSRVLSKDYTHSFLTFTGQHLDEKIGESFKIVGGCGMRLPALHAKPIEHETEFNQTVANAFFGSWGDLSNFSFNGKKYMALRIPVEEADSLEFIPEKKSQTKQTFLDLMHCERELKDIPLNLLNESLDSGKAGFIHYTAAFLPAETLKELASPSLLGVDSFKVQDAAGNTPLHFAAQEGNLETASVILAQFPDLVHVQNHQGMTPLGYAVQKGRFEMVKLLISFKACPNIRLPNGIFPLYMALQAQEAEIALWMIENIPELHLSETLDSKMTALHLALEFDLIEVAQKLIEKNASCVIKRRSDGFSPLALAISKGLVALVKLMQAQGVSLWVSGEYNRTNLHLAADYGQIASIEFLIAQNLDLGAQDSDGDSPLMRAIKKGQVEAAQILAEKAPVNQTNKKGETASLLALLFGMPHIMDKLIERGESPNHRDTKGYTCVYYLVRNGEYDRLKALIEAKTIDYSQNFVLDGQDHKGKNLLELAAQFRQFLIVYELLESTNLKMQEHELLEYAVAADEIGYVRGKAKPFLSKSYQTLSLIAARNGSVRCLSWLLKNQPEAKPEEYQLWFKVALEESNSVKTLDLLACRCEINEPIDAEGNTPLHLAVKQGFLQGVSLLLDAGALPHLRNMAGQTPFHIALIQKNDSALKRLFKRSPQKEWPRDLWQTPVNQPTRQILSTLILYRDRLNESVELNLKSSLEEKEELPEILLDQEKILDLIRLVFQLTHAQFNEACEFLNEKPAMLSLFRSKQGADLLKTAFSSMTDPALQKLEGVNEEEVMGPNAFLSLLKREGISPLLYKGEHNVLWTLMERDIAEENVQYRLGLLRKFFPESLSGLAVDEVHPGLPFIEFALNLNKISLFKALAEVSAQTSKQGKKPFYPLHEAVKADQYQLIQDLLKTYSVNEANDKGQTPLMLAAEKKNLSLVKFLLASGANPNAVDLFGRNILYYALTAKGEGIALHLIPLLREKNQADHLGETPLMWAARNGTLSVVAFYTEQGDYTESYDKKGWNALHHAAFQGQISCVELLFKKGFDLNAVENPQSTKKAKSSTKRVALHLAALNSKVGMVKTLIELGADLSLEDIQQQSFFEYGLQSKNAEMLEFMQGPTLYPLYAARQKQTVISAVISNHENAVCELILRGSPLNVSDSSGLSLLHLGALHNAGKVLCLLLQGGDLALNVADSWGMTPLHYAACCGHVRPLKLLCEAGADINYRSSKIPTPLFLACEQGKIGAVAVLLERKADYTLTNAEGLTPAQIALLKGYTEIVDCFKHEGDQSLTMDAVERLPKEIQEKLKTALVIYLKEENAQPNSVSGVLIKHGIYRQVDRVSSGPSAVPQLH